MQNEHFLTQPRMTTSTGITSLAPADHSAHTSLYSPTISSTKDSVEINSHSQAPSNELESVPSQDPVMPLINSKLSIFYGD